jgi:hypothetical protein
MGGDIDIRKDLEAFAGDSLSDLDELASIASALESRRQRVALVFDATSSMYPYWKLAKDTINRVVDGIQSKAAVPVQFKVVAYRDVRFDIPAIEASEWSGDASYLKAFTESVYCQGGGDFPESIGHGLREVMGQEASQIILIGDAPGHYGSEGHTEASECKQAECPIYALYTVDHEDTKGEFETIARLSGGKAFHLTSTTTEAFEDVMNVLIASNKNLAINYEPRTLEGRAIKGLLA